MNKSKESYIRKDLDAPGIYGIHNKVNDKWYVGQAQNMRIRWNQHKSLLSRDMETENVHLLSAWKKYGEEAFEVLVLEYCRKEDLDEREQYWIKEKDSYKNGYNRTIGGGGLRGFYMPESQKKAIGRLTKEKWADPEHKRKRLAAMRAVMQTEEYRQKLSEAGKRNWANPEFKKQSLERMQVGAKQPEAMKKRKASLRKAFEKPESKAKLSEASKHTWKSEEYQEKMRAARDRFMNEEYRERARRQSKERWKSDEYRNLVARRVSEEKRKEVRAILQVETGCVFRSIADVAEALQISHAHISSACLGKRRTAGKYHWRYAEESQGDWEKRRERYVKERGIRPYPKVVCIETGEIFEQPKVAAQKIGVHPSNITKVCSGEQLTAGKLHWKYCNETQEQKEKREALIKKSKSKVLGENSRVRVRCIETNTEFDSVGSAAKKYGINRSGISNALRGKCKTAGGYHWEYV